METRIRLQNSSGNSGSQLELVDHKDSKENNHQGDRNFHNSANSVDTFSDYSSKFSLSSPNGPLKHRERHHSRRMRRRLVYKNGECNISHANIKKRRQRFLADIFTTLVDIKWRWNLLIFVLAFTLSWLIFALIWWLICFSHGDFENVNTAGWKACVAEVKDFTTALLFSIETQHTIGYGSRQTNPYCPEAVVVMMMQSCCGVIIQALMTGLVFAKLSRPKKRAETLMFSKNAVICRRDGVYCLLFRVGDMRKSHIVEAHIKGLFIQRRITKEGEMMPLFQYDVTVGTEEGNNSLFLVWPVIIEHKITEESPFWEVSQDDLHRMQFELIVILEGIVESTGMTAQARSSYLPEEILWGHRFERLITFQKENGEYQIDYSRFHSTIPVDMPTCSAREMAEMSPEPEEEKDLYEDDDDDDDDDDETSSSITSTTKEGQSPTPLIMRHGTSQTMDTDSREDAEDEEPNNRGNVYRFINNMNNQMALQV